MIIEINLLWVIYKRLWKSIATLRSTHDDDDVDGDDDGDGDEEEDDDDDLGFEVISHTAVVHM